MKPTKVIQVLEGLVYNRFSMESLNEHLQKEFKLDAPMVIEDVTEGKDECDTSDYNLMCCLDAHGIFCDIDIYFLRLRKPDYDNNTIYVTEVGWEFQ
jgi:hypothetical protein